MSNLLSEVHPELVLEWSERNLPLTPDKITYGSNKIVWWIGTCGHEYDFDIGDYSEFVDYANYISENEEESEPDII